MDIRKGPFEWPVEIGDKVRLNYDIEVYDSNPDKEALFISKNEWFTVCCIGEAYEIEVYWLSEDGLNLHETKVGIEDIAEIWR